MFNVTYIYLCRSIKLNYSNVPVRDNNQSIGNIGINLQVVYKIKYKII